MYTQSPSILEVEDFDIENFYSCLFSNVSVSDNLCYNYFSWSRCYHNVKKCHLWENIIMHNGQLTGFLLVRRASPLSNAALGEANVWLERKNRIGSNHAFCSPRGLKMNMTTGGR